LKELTDKRLPGDEFHSVDELIEAIDDCATHWNDNPKPFVWLKPAKEFIAKTRHGREALKEVKTLTDH
jgi:hypothetical protein